MLKIRTQMIGLAILLGALVFTSVYFHRSASAQFLADTEKLHRINAMNSRVVALVETSFELAQGNPRATQQWQSLLTAISDDLNYFDRLEELRDALFLDEQLSIIQSKLREIEELKQRLVSLSEKGSLTNKSIGRFIYNRLLTEMKFVSERMAVLSDNFLSFVNERYQQRLTIQQIINVLFGLGVLAVFCLAGHFIVRRLDQLAEASQNLARGEFDTRLPAQPDTEIGVVFNSFNDMVATLQSAYAQLEAHKQEAEHANSAKSRFLANMSHELRTPLNGVIGIVRLLMDDVLTQYQRERLSKVYTSSQLLLSLLNDLLDFSKIEAQKLELDTAAFDLRNTVENSVSLFASQAEEKNNELTLDISPDLARYWMGDANRISQVLNNLIGNAVKFTERGEIKVRVTAAEPPEQGISICVADQGIGIPASKLETIFQPYAQAEQHIASEYGGTGLGLTICKQLVELMGGRIDVVSEEKAGTFVTITLPLKVAEMAEQIQEEEKLEPWRVLVLDDNSSVLLYCQKLLTHWGFSVDTVTSVDAAKQAIREANDERAAYHLFLVDWMLAGESGLDLIEHVNELVTSKQLAQGTRIVLMTGFSPIFGEEQARLKDLSIDGMLEKPFQYQKIFDLLCSLQRLDNAGSQLTVGNHGLTGIDEIRKQLYKVRAATILLVEDNPVNQLLAEELLQKLGFNTLTASNGEQALDILSKQAVDLVLMDLQMPVMDGFEATKAIRAKEVWRDLPIVAMSASAMMEDRMAAQRAGMNDHLSKPISFEELAQKLLQWIPPL